LGLQSHPNPLCVFPVLRQVDGPQVHGTPTDTSSQTRIFNGVVGDFAVIHVSKALESISTSFRLSVGIG
jgi:hypothetical protein